MKNIRIEIYYGKEITPFVAQLAQLRITVFHDFPYLYEGSLEYETNYLKVYTDSEQSVLVAAFDGEAMIGAATALPLKDEADYVKEPFIKAQMKLDDIYYFGESVLLKNYRGLGLGHEFFNGRESAAKKFGFLTTSFCGVQRPTNHPMRPKDYRPLDEFWIKRGYTKHDSLKSEFKWLDIGDKDETNKTMIYWMKQC